MYYKISEYKFIKFEKSNRKNKMYNAVIMRKSDGKMIRIPFGDDRYENYRDKTNLNLYPNLIHGDELRRKRYQKRHEVYLRDGYWSPGHFSYYYLW